MKKLFLLFISSVFILSACGNKYDKEIEEVTKLEQQSFKKSQLDDRRTVKRSSSDYKVYNDGNIITMSLMPDKNSDLEVTRIYKLNQSSKKYEKDLNENVTEFQKQNKPDYEENNMKK